MRRLGPVATAVGRGVVRLLPAARRDWAEAVWAEAHEVGLAGAGFANPTPRLPDGGGPPRPPGPPGPEPVPDPPDGGRHADAGTDQDMLRSPHDSEDAVTPPVLVGVG